MTILLVHNSQIGAHTCFVAQKIANILHTLDTDSIIADISQPGWDSYQPESIIVLGGDGTIIKVAGQYAQQDIPVLGINMGTIGFLSNLEVHEISTKFMSDLLSGNYQLDERMMLEVSICDQYDHVISRYLSLNEVCIKTVASHMAALGIEIDGKLHTHYRGDGMLIASPTGSTAYSLSAGGPIIDPELEVILITPLLSYLLSKRTLVVASNKVITLFNLDKTMIAICIDGQDIITTDEPFQIIVKKARNHFKLINLKGRDFFASVDRRLGQNCQPGS